MYTLAKKWIHLAMRGDVEVNVAEVINQTKSNL